MGIIQHNPNYYIYPTGFGGVIADSSNFTLEDCEITNNSKAGVVAQYSNPIIKHTIISGNGAEGGFFQESPIIMSNSEILGNGKDGLRFQTIQNWGTTFTSDIQNCVIAKNNGVGVKFLSRNNAEIINCTIVDNNSSTGWGGIINSEVDTHLQNSIVYNNGNDLDFQAGGLYTYSIIQGNYVGSDTATTNLQNVEPLFRDAANGDYHLQSTVCGYSSDSPAIDAGDPSIRDYILDCSGGLGIIRSDIGAYGGAGNWWDTSVNPPCYYSGEVYGVWDCDTIYVNGNCVVPSDEALTINPGTVVLFMNHYTINVKGTVYANGNTVDSIKFIADKANVGFGGFTFYNLDTTSAEESQFEYCKFIGGKATGENDYDKRGGAISIVNSSKISIKNSLFFLNTADYLGGAIYIENGLPTISECQFDNNGTSGGGGAMALMNTSVYLNQLDFLGNLANDGGAVLMMNSSPIISNCEFGNNSANNGYGNAIHLSGSSPKLVNVTTAANGTGTDRIIYGMNNSNIDIINSILYDDENNIEVFLEEGIPTVTYSLVRNASNESWFGIGCIDTNPLFTLDNGNQLSSTEYGYTVNSPAIDAGHPDSLDITLSENSGKGTYREDMGAFGGRFYDFLVGVEDESQTEIPNKYSLLQNYPNPFNPSTTIKYSIPSAVGTGNIPSVQLNVYDVLGREIATLVNEDKSPGNYSVTFNASKLSSGIYFYQLKAGSFVDLKKMILMK